ADNLLKRAILLPQLFSAAKLGQHGFLPLPPPGAGTHAVRHVVADTASRRRGADRSDQDSRAHGLRRSPLAQGDATGLGQYPRPTTGSAHTRLRVHAPFVRSGRPDLTLSPSARRLLGRAPLFGTAACGARGLGTNRRGNQGGLVCTRRKWRIEER